MTPSALNSSKPTVTITPLPHDLLIQADAPFVPVLANAASGTFPSATSYLPLQIAHPPVLTTRDNSQVTIFESFRQAADQGQARAQYNLGLLYKQGLDIARSDTEAVKNFQLAAGQGYARAQYHLGVMYKEGRGVAQNYAKAVEYFHLAAGQGHAHAQYHLGVIYQDGEGVTQNYTEAIKYYHLAADQGHADAQYNLGDIYRNKRYAGHDYAKSVKHFQLAADQGHDYATLYLGHMYAHGVGVAKDYAKTLKCYQLAADQGNDQAQRHLGVLYQDGIGIPRDAEKAMRYFWKANRETGVIEMSNINDNTLQHLPDLFEEFGGYGQTNELQSVRELKLSNSAITDISAPIIALILKRTQTLTKLFLRNTDITCQGMEIILDALKNHNMSVIYCVFPETSLATDETLRKLSEQNTEIKNIMDGFDKNYPTYVPKPFDILPMEVLRQLLQTIAVVHTKIPAPPEQSTISSIITSIRSMFVSKPATTGQVMDNVYNVFTSDPGRALHEKG